MSKPRKTYYRINDSGEIEKVRRVIPPEGWTTDKSKLEMQLKAKQVELTLVGATDAKKVELLEALEPKQPIKIEASVEQPDDVLWLKEELERTKKQNKKLQLEVSSLRKRIQEDTQVIKRMEKDRMEIQMMELDRTAEFARNNNGISEDEYYRLKQAAQGLQEQLKALREAHEELRNTHNKATSEKNMYRNKIESYGTAINCLNSGVQKYYRLLNRLIHKIPVVEQPEFRKQVDRVHNKCTQLLQRMRWDSTQYEFAAF